MAEPHTTVRNQPAVSEAWAPRTLAPVIAALAAALALFAGVAGPAGATVPRLRHGTPPGPTAVPGEIVVGFRGSAGATARVHARSQAHVTVRRGLLVSHAQLVKVDRGQTVAAAIRALQARPDVRYAEPNYVYRATATAPDDPGFANQWDLENAGQDVNGDGAGMPGADAGVLPAWDFGLGAGALVAVVDSGVAWDHPDLAPNIWRNPGEIPGNGVDDDHNGMIDDVRGWDFVGGDDDPWDTNDHGTHVAGTIAAAANNGTGIAGMAPQATIMPVRALDADGSGTDASIADAMTYAADNGARVVNLSLGGPGQSIPIHDAIASHPDTLFVVAAGNDGVDNDSGTGTYPCDDPSANVICVAATNNRDQMPLWSNYGAVSVDIAAPGVDIYSTRPHYTDAFSDDFEGGLGKWANTTGSWGESADGSGDTWLAVAPSDIDAAIQTKDAIDLQGQTGCVLRFDYASDVPSGAILHVQSSTDGTTWTDPDLAQYGTTDLYIETETIQLQDGASRFYRFHYTSDGTDAGYGAYIDDVEVGCRSGTYGPSDYQFLDGTSMATPHVSGAAAVLLGAVPDATVSQVRSALLDSGDPVSALAGKTVTGRRLDLLAALRALPGAIGPSAVTGAATTVDATSATLQGQVDPDGRATTYHFEARPAGGTYGTLRSADLPAGTTSGAVPVSATVSGLQPSTAYAYRLVAVDDNGKTSIGDEGAFTTAAPPATPVAPAPPATTTTTITKPKPKPRARVRCRARGRRVTCAVSYPGLRRASFTVRLGRRVYARGSARHARSGRYVRLHSVRRPRHGRRYVVTVRFVDVHGRVRLLRARARL